MPAVSKGLTSEFRARIDDTEAIIITSVVGQFAELGTTISRNDALRLLIRYGWDSYPLPAPPDLATARQAITGHWNTCQYCSPDGIGCPWGVPLKAAYDRLAAAPERRPAPEVRGPAAGPLVPGFNC